MADRIPIDKLSLLKLSKIHDFKNFTCGENEDCRDLDAFLKDDALLYQEKNLATTYICIFNEIIVGYVTLCSGGVKISEKEKSALLGGLQIREIPGLKIARLAVHVDYQKRGIGRSLILHALKKARQMKNDVGLRVVTVDAKKGAIAYYEKLGFAKLEKYIDKDHPCMYIDIGNVDDAEKS